MDVFARVDMGSCELICASGGEKTEVSSPPTMHARTDTEYTHFVGR